MEYGYKKKPKFIVIFSFFYLLYPIINIVAFLSTTPPSVALSTLQDFILGNITIDKKYLAEIPKKVIQCIKEEERTDAKVIMSRYYYKLLEINSITANI